MKKAALVLAVAAIAVVLLATPVMAVSPNKTPVTVENIKTLGYYYDPSTYRWVTDGDIAHIVYIRLWGSLEIHADEQVISGTYVDIVTGTYNLKTQEGVWKWEEVWTLPGGTFEGTAHVRTVGGTILTWMEFYAHILLHGTGSYEGQIFDLDMSRPSRSVPAIYEGSWLKP